MEIHSYFGTSRLAHASSKDHLTIELCGLPLYRRHSCGAVGQRAGVTVTCIVVPTATLTKINAGAMKFRADWVRSSREEKKCIVAFLEGLHREVMHSMAEKGRVKRVTCSPPIL